MSSYKQILEVFANLQGVIVELEIRKSKLHLIYLVGKKKKVFLETSLV